MPLDNANQRRRSRKLQLHERVSALEMLRSGASSVEVAKRFGCSSQAIQQLWESHGDGIRLRDRAVRNRKIGDIADKPDPHTLASDFRSALAALTQSGWTVTLMDGDTARPVTVEAIRIGKTTTVEL